MIHQTFYHLPEEKQRRILQSALTEFCRLPYEKTSINRIIQEAQIPKGSFYQYFDKKEDLYVLCIKQAYQKLLDARISRKESLLESGFQEASRLGITEFQKIHTEALEKILSPRESTLIRQLPQAPSQLRNAALFEIAISLIKPQIKKELEESKTLPESVNIDYYAYLISLSEMIALDYGSRNGYSTEDCSQFAYEYLELIAERGKK